jgi:hypothetical protein
MPEDCIYYEVLLELGLADLGHRILVLDLTLKKIRIKELKRMKTF